jgi:cytochrome d ubiquinol oxidase subunit II
MARQRSAPPGWPWCGLPGALWLLWTQADGGNVRSLVALVVAVLALLGALAENQRAREGWAFTLSGITVAAAVAMLFLALYPDVMPSSLDPAWSLTVANASSSAYTLKVMTWVAAIMTPVVLLYQSWTYWVFRKRIGVEHIPA